MTRICVLQLGDTPPDLVAEHGAYGAMVARLVAASGACDILDATRGQLPERVEGYDAYVLTGSPAGVYEDHPWIPPLARFLLAARGKAKLVGICFGHQMLAQTFGGRVVKSPKGWGVGIHRYDVIERAPWMDDTAAVSAPASHQDQVVERPPGARVTLASPFTPYAGLDYGDAISFQCHPEFTTPFGVGLISGRRDLFGDLADPAIASYAAPDDRTRIGGWINAFLRRA